jgi:cytochrome c553
MTRRTVVGSVVLALIIGGAIFLRPRSAAKDELAAPATIPPAMLGILKTKMVRHNSQMNALMSRIVLLDDAGVAHAAGELLDEPSLARPVTGDELNGVLPERFYTLQEEVRNRARQLVNASTRHDRVAVADEFAALAKACVTCHEIYLRGADGAPPAGTTANAVP